MVFKMIIASIGNKIAGLFEAYGGYSRIYFQLIPIAILIAIFVCRYSTALTERPATKTYYNSNSGSSNNKKKHNEIYIGFVAFAYERLCSFSMCFVPFRARSILWVMPLRLLFLIMLGTFLLLFPLAVIAHGVSICDRAFVFVCVCVCVRFIRHLPSLFIYLPYIFGSRLAINVCSEFTNIPTTTIIITP